MTRSRAIQMETPTAPTRTRVRPSAEPSAKLVETAEKLYVANKEKNAAASKERTAKKNLHKEMIGSNTSEFEFDGTYKNTTTRMKAVIDSDEVEYMDVHTLKSLVDEDTFMKIVSATKTAVEEIAGEHVVIQCTKTMTKEPSLKLRKVED